MSSNDQVSGENFSSAKYVASATGVIRILVIVLLLCGAIIFLSNDNCPGTPAWHDWLYPVVTTTASALVTIKYAAFVCGIAKSKPAKWITIDSVFSIAESIVVIAVSVVAMFTCTAPSKVQKVPGPLGISAGLLLIISTAALYVNWKQKEESKYEMENKIDKENITTRPSILV